MFKTYFKYLRDENPQCDDLANLRGFKKIIEPKDSSTYRVNADFEMKEGIEKPCNKIH